MSVDVSVCLPAMRTPYWLGMYESMKESCKRYSFEMVLVSPFDPPKEIEGIKNIQCLKSFARPSTCCQMAVDACKGELWFNGADDAKHVPDAVDLAVDLWHSLNDRKAIVNMRYTEGDSALGQSFPTSYWWNAHTHPPLARPGVPGHYKMCMNPLMSVEYFKELGGFDCAYEYQNFNIHDFIFRAQYDGATIHLSPTDTMLCDHFGDGTPMGTADHYPIQAAYPIDHEKFRQKYMNPDALRPDNIKIDFNHWKQYTETWSLRFGQKMYNSYEEMLRDRGINV